MLGQTAERKLCCECAVLGAWGYLELLREEGDIKVSLPVCRRFLSSADKVNNNNNAYLLQLGCYPVAVVILHVYKT